MNLQEQFYQKMTKLKANSRATSTRDARGTEMVNELLVSKTAKRIEHISETKPTNEPQAQVCNFTRNGPVLEGKAASVPGINKLKAIQDFINSN